VLFQWLKWFSSLLATWVRMNAPEIPGTFMHAHTDQLMHPPCQYAAI